MLTFEQALRDWLQKNIQEEKNQRRREILEKGLGHGTVEFLRLVWYPTVGNFEHLYPEWEVRDFNNGYRYLDLAYISATFLPFNGTNVCLIFIMDIRSGYSYLLFAET